MQSTKGCVIAFLLISGCLTGCEKRVLRGRIARSQDGQTYLSIDDDNGGKCPIFVDGKPWKRKIGSAAAMTPGDHTVTFKCWKNNSGADYGVTISRGTIFHFDYWGP